MLAAGIPVCISPDWVEKLLKGCPPFWRANKRHLPAPWKLGVPVRRFPIPRRRGPPPPFRSSSFRWNSLRASRCAPAASPPPPYFPRPAIRVLYLRGWEVRGRGSPPVPAASPPPPYSPRPAIRMPYLRGWGERGRGPSPVMFDSAANYATADNDGWLPLAAFSQDMNCSDQPGMHVQGLNCCCIPRNSYWPRPLVSPW
jgi:hypothetical protein